MSFTISTQAELLKTKRTASFWLSILGAAFVPAFFFLFYTFNPEEALKGPVSERWVQHFKLGWMFLCTFISPVYVILICALIPQIEFKNNTWKQVFASPQTMGNIFFSKFLAIHVMILFCFVLFNLLMILVGVVVDLFNSKFGFLGLRIDWAEMLQMNVKIYISVLSISAFQYWLSLRFKNFVAPIGIGLALVIVGIIGYNFQWEHIYKFPFAYPVLTLESMKKPGGRFLENHELNALGFFAVFIIVGFFDMKLRKAKG